MPDATVIFLLDASPMVLNVTAPSGAGLDEVITGVLGKLSPHVDITEVEVRNLHSNRRVSIRRHDRTEPTARPDQADRRKVVTWGRWCQSAPVSCVHPVAEHTARPGRSRGHAAVEVQAGPDAGFHILFPPGSDSLTLGKAEHADVVIDDPELDPPVRVPASTAGRICVGATRLKTNAALPLHRSLDSIEWPQPPKVDPIRVPKIWQYAVPIVIGVVLAAVTHMWWFLLFSITSPITAYVTYSIDRRRFSTQAREAVSQYRAQLNEFASAAQTFISGHVERINRAGPADEAHCVLGYGTAQLDTPIPRPPSSSESDPLSAHWDRLRRKVEIAGHRTRSGIFPWVSGVQIAVDMTSTAVTIRGDREAGLALTLSILHQLLASGVPVSVSGSRCPPVLNLLLANSDAQAGACAVHAEFGDEIAVGPADPSSSITVACEAPSSAVLECVNDGAPGPVSGHVHVRGMQLSRFISLTTFPPASPAHILESTSIAQLDVSHSNAVGTGFTLRESSTREGATTAVPDEIPQPIALDLFCDGPHALVAGTTGSGKSVFLKAWLQMLCLTTPPEELRLVLIDFKGGATFNEFTELPHTDSVISNLEINEGIRALRSVYAEVLRREKDFAQHRVSDIDAYNHHASAATGDDDLPHAESETAGHSQTDERTRTMPRIVLVIDEFHAFISEVPDGTEILEKLTALGRSLGVHVILATQRPAGIVTPRMKTNIPLRICLRVRDPSDSHEVVECDAAAYLDPHLPGTGIISDGVTRRIFRSATPIDLRITGSRAHSSPHLSSGTVAAERSGSQPENRITWTSRDPHQQVRGAAAVEHVSEPTDLHERRVLALTAPIRRAARRIVQDPLPRVYTPAAADCEATALIDYPDTCEQRTWHFSPPFDGNIVIAGAPRSGRSHLLDRLAHNAHGAGHFTVLLSAAEADARKPFHVTASAGWSIEYVTELIRHNRTSAPVFLAIDDLDDLTSQSPRLISQIDELVRTCSFAAVGTRRTLHSSIGIRAGTTIILPSGTASEAVAYGFPRHRFRGMSPAGRGVMISPQLHGSSDADLQVSAVDAEAPQMPCQALLKPADAAAGQSQLSVSLGTGPSGEPICWSPRLDGHTLVLRVSRQGQAQAIGLIDHIRHIGITVSHDAHLNGSAGAADLSADRPQAIVVPLSFTPGFSSPLAAALSHSPTLIIGARTAAELSHLGHRDLPPVPEGWSWWLTGDEHWPVKLTPQTPNN